MQKLIGALLMSSFLYNLCARPFERGVFCFIGAFLQSRDLPHYWKVGIGQRGLHHAFGARPTHETALYQLARIFFTENNFFEAEQLLATGTSAYPENQWMWRLQAVNARQLGDMATALSSYEALMVLRPDQLNMYKTPFKVRLAGNSEKALTFLKRTGALYGDGPEIVQQKMEIHLRNNDKGCRESTKAGHERLPTARGIPRARCTVLRCEWQGEKGRENLTRSR